MQYVEEAEEEVSPVLSLHLALPPLALNQYSYDPRGIASFMNRNVAADGSGETFRTSVLT